MQQVINNMLHAHPTARFSDVIHVKRKPALLPRNDPRFHYTYNARGAIYQTLMSLPRDRRDTVLLPAFHCPTVVEPALQANYRVEFYTVRPDLSADEAELRAKINHRTAAVLVINYFGFPFDMQVLTELRSKHDFCLIEDFSHSFVGVHPLRLNGERGDVSVCTFWKIVPCLVGGGVRINNPTFNLRRMHGRPGVKNSALRIKQILDEAIGNLRGGPLKTAYDTAHRWRTRIKRRQSAPAGQANAEPITNSMDAYRFDMNLATATMPWLSKRILQGADLEAITFARRRNFQILLDQLPATDQLQKVFDTLPDDVCPWAFPAILRGRQDAKLDYQLWHRGVPIFTFGNVLHPLFDRASPDIRSTHANYLADNLICLPIHQNLSAADVENMCGIIKVFFAERAQP